MRAILLRFSPMLLLAGCAGSLQELKSLAPAANDFSSSLAAEYLAYSESEYEQGRWISAEHFAGKGIKAAGGEAVTPDKANNSLLDEYRASLLQILATDVKKEAFQNAARTQLLFDCWNAQEESNTLEKQVSCAEEFEQAYDELKELAEEMVQGEDNQYTIHFVENSAQLYEEEKNSLTHFAERVQKNKDYKLELEASSNDKPAIARKRIETVSNYLIRQGVAKNNIIVKKIKANADSVNPVILSNDDIESYKDRIEISIVSPAKTKGEGQ